MAGSRQHRLGRSQLFTSRKSQRLNLIYSLKIKKKNHSSLDEKNKSLSLFQSNGTMEEQYTY